MTWFRVGGGSDVPTSLKSRMNAVFNKKFGTSGQNYPPNGWPADVNLLGPLPEKTVAGAFAHTDDAADTVPVKSMICSIVPKQAGTGTPSPTNVRAITGYSGMTISRLGKNLFNVSNYSEIYTERDGVDSYNYRYKIIQLKPNTTYTVSQNSGSYSGTPIILINNTLPVGGANYFDLRKASDTKTYTTDETGCLYIGSVNSYDDVAYARLQVCNVQIEVGSTATTFTPFVTPETISDSWSSIGEIYGGERDLTLGTLKKSMNVQVYRGDDLDSVSITYGSTAEGYTHLYFAINGVTIADNPTADNTFSNMAPWSNGAADGTIPSAEGFRIINGGSPARPVVYWYINKTWADVAAFKAWLNDNPFVLCYPVTQTTYSDLQTYDFETLYAVNNFYSNIDGGQTQVTYRQDIALALQVVSSSRGLMMASRPVTQLVGEESDPDQVNELVENDETEQEGEDNAR